MALTVQQPFAHLLSLPDTDDRAKRVENRTWSTNYRGPLAIHAGKGRDYLDDGDLETFPDMAFGAIVAVANLAACFELEYIPDYSGYDSAGDGYYSGRNVKVVPQWALRHWPWLAGHQHVEGPWCWVLTEVRRLPKPVPCKGAQGLWNVPHAILATLSSMY